MEKIVRIPVLSGADVALARLKGRALAQELGFSPLDLTLITAAISELARSIVYESRRGELVLRSISRGQRSGMTVLMRQEPAAAQAVHPALRPPRPAVPSADIQRVENMVDEFEMVRAVGGATTVTATKWLPD